MYTQVLYTQARTYIVPLVCIASNATLLAAHSIDHSLTHSLTHSLRITDLRKASVCSITVRFFRAGPMAFCLVQAVEQGQASTYNVLLRAIRYALKNGPQHFVQAPQLFSSRPLDFNEAVVL